jgi:para-nitrobenzyl esterase
MQGKCNRILAAAVSLLAASAAGLAGAAERGSGAEPAAVAAAPVAPLAPLAPKVTVDTGLLVGTESGGVVLFAGVPYAAPPIGPLRWQPPQRPASWTGERSAAAAGPNCMQTVDAAGVSRGGGPVSEDCLTLEVFAPKGAHQAPVMVWVHGGSNIHGAGSKSLYDGSAFARDGIVLVAINYRLGPFGFFAHKALTRLAQPREPLANYALMDQIAALQWVRRNIAAFGGDPRNVTVFGESAGGTDLLALMTAASAHDLFARVIVESPGATWEPLAPLAEAEAQGAEIVAKLGLDDAATGAQLRALPAERLMRATQEMDDRFGPVADGRLLTQSLTKAFVHGDAAAVPLVIGSNSYEASLVGSNIKLSNIPATIRDAYSGEPSGDLEAAIFTDRNFTAPVRWFARQAAKHAPVWLYRFSYVRLSQRQKTPGAPHASELPYVFDSWDKISSRASLLPAEDRAMTALVHSCWVAFARTGVPACQGAPPWPAYTTHGDELLDLGQTPAVRQHFRQPQLDAQEQVAAAKGAAAAASHP